MTQRQIDRAVAAATGETVSTIGLLGYSLADPLDVGFDPEPVDPIDKHLDWDELHQIESPRRDHRRCPSA